MNYFYKEMKSPVGRLKLISDDHALVAVLWENDPPMRVPLDEAAHDKNHPVLVQAEDELNEYFAGTRTRFSVPLNPHGTDFQKSVWMQLRKIPYGETRSYKDLAVAIGNPSACRAVGAANGKNPLSIIVPCHRVIGSNGTLTGFAGGLEFKNYLLNLESPQGSFVK
ncbi:MAG TPA: methylated-DNA--[protein]-cysteine S-methyltransferase [Bdellovibrio sp.]|uniref:methylated-DNA--[protein]-cysteine S-methyltransferase n=1 Tax=Bdellovibrio sp. TaxID=28201 RepID=UPI002F039235